PKELDSMFARLDIMLADVETKIKLGGPANAFFDPPDVHTRAGGVEEPNVTEDRDGPKVSRTFKTEYDVNNLVLGKRSNVAVGSPVASEADGRDILRRLAAGDRTALRAVGLENLPDSFDPRHVEWGLGRTVDRKIIVIRGEGEGPREFGAINWD